MAYIREKTISTGETHYRAEIMIKKKGKIIHRESKTFSRRPEATTWSKEREAYLRVNGIPKKNEGMTLADLIENYISEYSEVLRFGRSKEMDFKRLKNEPISHIACKELTSGKLIDHIKKRVKSGVKPQTANNDIVWINVLLKFGIATFDIEADISQVDAAKSFLNSAGLIKRADTRDRIPTPEEHHSLIELYKRRDGRSSIPMIDILEFAMYSSRRQGEITRILWDDNNDIDKTGMVRDLKHPRMKKGNNRRFSYTDEAWEVIQRQPKNQDRIFPYNGRSVSSNFTRSCKILGIEDLRFHDYRHLATSWLFTQGHPIQEVTNFTLHESWETLKRYTHLSPERKRDIREIYNASPQQG